MILTGECPFGISGNIESDLKLVIDKELDFVENAALDSVSFEARDLVENLLSKDPRERLTVLEIRKQGWIDQVSVET